MYKATKQFEWEMAHVLTNYNGPCGNLHGHSYKCFVTFVSNTNTLENGMIKDFKDMKTLCNHIIFDDLDHCCAFNRITDDAFEKELMDLCIKHNKKIYEFDFRTTAENMSKYIYDIINKELEGTGIRCSNIDLYETRTGCATYGE